MGSRRTEHGTGTAIFLHLAPLAIDPKMDYSKESPTLVEFRLEKTPNGTLLVLTESGFDKIPSQRRLEAFRMNDGGWTEQMKNLENHVAQTP